MAKQADIFRVRLNCIDHYQHPPSSLDPPLWGPPTSTQRGNLPQVPVIRVFGATETGQKVCAHIHGALPYLYIPYTESLEKESVEPYISTLRHSIDHALALSYRRNPYDPRNSTFVAHISLVKGVPFFGYNVGYHYYLKVYLLNPQHMTRFSDLLQQGAILKRVFQPYEAHLQYLLQWMCDFNLYGCAYIEVNADKVGWRSPVPEWLELEDPAHLWHDRSIAPNAMLQEDRFQRQSHCQLELDFSVEDIINRSSIRSRELHHSFVERLSSLENLPPEEKLVHSMAGLWKDETRRRKTRMGLSPGSDASSPFPAEVLVSMSADPRNDSKGGWIHEQEFRGMVEELAQQERKARGDGDITFESFGAQKCKVDADGIQTVLESVVELFHEHSNARWSHKAAGNDEVKDEVDGLLDNIDGAQTGLKPEGEPLVDMSSIAQVADDDDYGSDEDTARTKALTQRQKLKDAGLEAAMGEAKVNGDAEDIEAEAGQIEDARIPAEMVERAEHGKSLLKRAAPISSQGPFKKPKLDAPLGDERPQSRHVSFRVRDVKPERPPRGRVSDDAGLHDVAPPSSQRFSKQPRPNAPQHMPPSAQPPSSSQHSTSSQQSSPQKNKLFFPVVKDAHDPETPLRLSQRDDLAHISQRSSQQSSLKHLSFASDLLHDEQSTSSKADNNTPTQGRDSRPRVSKSLPARYATAFTSPAAVEALIYSVAAPPRAEVESTIQPAVVYQDAYYSNENDVPERPREYAGQEFRLESTTLPYLPVFDKDGAQYMGKGTVLDKAKLELDEQRRRRECSLKAWEIMIPPPTYAAVQAWVDCEAPAIIDDLDALEVDGPPQASNIRRSTWHNPASELPISQIDGPTQKNKHGFKYSQRKASTSVQHETGYMSTMALEVHINSRGELAPDPERDEVGMVVWCLADEQLEDGEEVKVGIVVLAKEGDDGDAERVKRIQKIVGNKVQVDTEDNELDLLNRMVDIVRACDPDIMTGFEVHNGSWGYLIERARLVYEFNLPDEFSRMRAQSHGRFGKEADRWGFTHTSTVRITGRHTINIWRAMRSELNLLQYTMENVVFHLLRRRIPHYKFADLTRWYRSGRPRDLAKVLEYFMTRTRLDLDILDANELIPRTSEQARLLGVDFFSVFSRGSQFKVESLMFRIAKPESFVLVSPSRKQVGAQNALECLPLVMEPQSAFYTSPLLVLDFQSLYPSVMIAYNYCYSTCLGRIVSWRGSNKMGFADFQRSPGLLELVKDHVNIAPNGMMYVKPSMRKSLLAKMLGEILETRVMVKSGMKVDKDDKTLQQLLNNRQLALKLIANVTYGYTSASFSGRMPCSEIADSIVQTGRETLEKAIALIHSVERWGAEVVYGDTDSLFVYLKGRTRAEAFKIGDEIAKRVTEMNPRPVKLKFEKVYHPCVLLAKKRYVGFKYESPSQTEPEFDAKGIETVRRDGTPAEQKIEEKALKLLFRTSDLSEVKRYFQSQCTKIMQGRFSVQDFCFAKEVKLGTYADKGPPPPGALIATKRMLRDPRAEPQYGERVPYVVIAGAPGARLWERCVEPERLIYDEHADLDAEYYISKNLIPPLERIFNLVGANVRGWYDEMPKVQRIRMLGGPREGEVVGKGKAKKTMESYMGSSLCLICRTKLPPVPAQTAHAQLHLPLCTVCREERSQQTLLALRQKLRKAEKKVKDMEDVCRSCANLPPVEEEVRCDSRDCPVFYSRVKANTQLSVAKIGVGRVLEAFEEEVAVKMEHGLEW
ncbi:hypothetical protein LTR36_005518 [Oleoguttula mirabilis]|uniref:DNA polymerase n=1 Tax=Oleoguttula mirabilis TaxID=1507867 RepID=A0AAV9JDL5_9PEZI|nr:hypothetical protein LTR36_005518 [Oleoguttula mirabilis]